MDNENTDVNENGSQTLPQEHSSSSGIESNENIESNGSEGAQSAETLNADNKVPGDVPYTRFKEVNDRARQSEERIKEYEEKIQVLSALEALAEESPEFVEEFKGLIEKSRNPKVKNPKTEKPQQATNDDPIVSLKRDLDEIKAKEYRRNVESSLNSYESDFEKRAESIPHELRGAFDEIVAKSLLEQSRGDLTTYNSKHLDKAYDKAMKIFEPAIQKMTVSAPAQNVPSSVPRNIPNASNVPKTREERSAMIHAALEKGDWKF